MTRSRHDEALVVAESLLDDIEMARLDTIDAVRRAMRVARLTDDVDASEWLLWEVNGYPATGGVLDERARTWAHMSGRVVRAEEATSDWPRVSPDASERVNQASVSRLALIVEILLPHVGPSASPAQVTRDIYKNLNGARRILTDVQTAVHLWAGGVHHRLRFGAAVETAFEVVRTEVDAAIGALVPDALVKLSAAFENTTSDNPEDWASAAATCRRLLKAAADALRPPGPPVDSHIMDEEHYINRLIDWISSQGASETATDMIVADLSYVGRRLEAAVTAGHKGAHAEVSRFDASRFITGTYLLLGDILRLRAADRG